MTKSYKRIASDMKLIEIVEFLHQQIEPVSASDLVRALGMPHATVMSHMASLMDARWIKITGGNYEIGPRLPGLFAAYTRGLREKVATLQTELTSLEG